ncbi:MAG TPA: hypothetical protein VFT22_26640, partial [Kofleriaceae bacterium]|nr:hypothetical protein [Kofleriaceae bacterium]
MPRLADAVLGSVLVAAACTSQPAQGSGAPPAANGPSAPPATSGPSEPNGPNGKTAGSQVAPTPPPHRPATPLELVQRS